MDLENYLTLVGKMVAFYTFIAETIRQYKHGDLMLTFSHFTEVRCIQGVSLANKNREKLQHITEMR